MILIIDNYDSFTYNLYQYLSELGADVQVRRNDQVTLDEIEALQPQGIVVSPGPCTPREAGISQDVILRMGPLVPTLGVCLGHQCVGQAFGATVAPAGEIMHGKMSDIRHTNLGVFQGLPNPFPAIRYHSLAVQYDTIPDCLEITAWTHNGLIMGLRHKEHPIQGVQFHPESIMTATGHHLLRNYLSEVAAASS